MGFRATLNDMTSRPKQQSSLWVSHLYASLIIATAYNICNAVPEMEIAYLVKNNWMHIEMKTLKVVCE